MSTTSSRPLRITSAPLLIVMAGAVVLLVLGYLALPSVRAYFESRSNTENLATLRLVTGGVHQAIGRFSPLPELIAEGPIFEAVLREPDNQGLVPFVNEKLRLLSQSLGVSDIYLMDIDGLTIAASNYREESSFMGRNFDYRPYFTDALSGESAIFHALGTTSGKPGFFFAAPVLDGVEIVGVLAVKVSTEMLEAGWAGASREILVADSNGIVFLTSRPDLRYRSLAPLSDTVLQTVEATRQFPLDVLQPLSASANLIRPGSVELQFAIGPQSERYLSNSASLDIPGWHAIVISPIAPIDARAYTVLGVWALGVLALALAVYVALQRQVRIAERQRLEASQREMLEGEVKARTAELREANTSLRSEVAERRHAEERLRQTQKELVQAGKLAALGQMSAALSHEINQPLAAVKTYADNAVAFLDRSQPDDARQNLSYISKMAVRMAGISKHLRNFARRPQEDIGPVDLEAAVNDALALMQPRLNAIGATVEYDGGAAGHWAIGGQLRLQQVIINLLNNALDAMARQDNPKVQLYVDRLPNGETKIAVIDQGPGLSAEVLEHVFDPFFTTKAPGKGLGLGLSISYNIVEDFGGRLEAANHEDGGAEFSIVLKSCEIPEAAELIQAETDQVAAE